MSFGGATRTGFVCLEDMMLDMVEFALDGGKKWARCNSKAFDNRFCLVGAVILVCRETRNADARDQIVSYLARAVWNWGQRNRERIFDTSGEQTIVMWFNNAPKRRFTHIIEVIREARELAQIDAYIAEMERKAGRSANPDPAVRRLAVELAGLIGESDSQPRRHDPSRAKASAPV
jgi:hypothetical protein